jgi:hypothetical protein
VSLSLKLRLAAGLLVAGLAGCFCLLGPFSLFSHTTSETDSTGLPRNIFWAWERPEDLRFLIPAKQGVAFLARTIELRQLTAADAIETKPASARDFWFPDPAASLGVRLKPRLQPLQVSKETPLIAVVRIETTNDLWHRPEGRPGEEPWVSAAKSLYTQPQREAVADMAVAAARLPQVKALQIDFDASQSEQPFYAELLQDVRRRLPRGMPLSITALASWCIGDPWLDRLPPGTIDEAVPMLFRMGPDALEVASYVESGKDFRSRACRGSLGVSTDERFSQGVLSGAISSNGGNWSRRRIYVFSPEPWAKKEAGSVTSEVAEWHRD